jgi:inosine triphosphate pyrophosphatase
MTNFVVDERVTFITGNSAKAEQLGRYLDFPVSHLRMDLKEVQSLNLTEIIEYKAREAYRQVGRTVLVEDVSLVFHALGNLPGPLIKWFLVELGNDGLCTLFNKYADRSALAEVKFGLYDGNELKVFDGQIAGSIAYSPRGDSVFGWECIFIPKDHERTWGEMNKVERQETSMRNIALKKLESYLKRLH